VVSPDQRKFDQEDGGHHGIVVGQDHKLRVLEREIWELEWVTDCLEKVIEVLVWDILHL